MSSFSLCYPVQAEIVWNSTWHCWRHLDQSCFDFLIHVSCSRLSPHVKGISDFLLNSLLRIAQWLPCLLANTMHCIYCLAISGCMNMPTLSCFLTFVTLEMGVEICECGIYVSAYIKIWWMFCDGVCLSRRLHTGDRGVCVNHSAVSEIITLYGWVD